jgi:hypothetical protein
MLWLLLLITPLATALGFVSGYLETRDNLPPPLAFLGAVLNSPWFLASLLICLNIWAFSASMAYWNAIDELAREAHKRAWFWGGSLGLGIGLGGLGIAALVEPFASLTFPDIAPVRLLAIGAAISFVFGLIGYAVAWAVFWWRAR